MTVGPFGRGISCSLVQCIMYSSEKETAIATHLLCQKSMSTVEGVEYQSLANYSSCDSEKHPRKVRLLCIQGV